MRVADGEPDDELQVDFGKMGLLADPDSGRRRVCWALIFTACYSRHCLGWLSFAQTTKAVIDGFEAAWAFFDGVFRIVIPDNMKMIVDRADALEPRFNEARLLGLGPGIPVFHLIRTAYDETGRPVEVCDTIMAADRYTLTYELPAI